MSEPFPARTRTHLWTAAAIACVSLLTALARTPASAGPIPPQTWEDLPPGTAVDEDKTTGALFLEGAEVAESPNFGLCSGTRFLVKRANPAPKGEPTSADPGPLTLVFQTPQAFVGMCVGNPDGKLPREIQLLGFSSSDANKPVATARIVLPPGTPVAQTLSLCRVLDRDLQRVELYYGDEGLEMLDDLQVGGVEGGTTRITFEEYPQNTLIESQYAGVSFPTRPEIVTSAALGVGTHSEAQALRQRIAGENDPGPLVIDFSPTQGAVRVRTGYPAGEKQTGPLHVRLLAFAAGTKGFVEVASHEVDLAQPQDIRRTLEVCRWEADIARVEVHFDSSFGGHEVIDDLEFGPRQPAAIVDTMAPVIRMDSPADNTVIAQPSSRDEHRNTTVTLRGRIEEDRALSSLRVQVLDASGNVRFDDGERMGVVRGSVPTFTFETPILLEYGASRVRVTAIDASGHATTLEHHLSYLGPPPVEFTAASPNLGYPPIVFREASPTGPAISNAPTVVRITGQNFHAETRFFLVAESRASLPPSAPDLIEVPPRSRSSTGDAVELLIPETVHRAPGRYVWLVWDLWGRPGATEWTRGSVFESRAWPYAALWSIGFRNRDEQNETGDFEGVYGEDVLPGFLEPATPINDCDRGVNAINFFLGRYLPTLNSPGAGGSCFGFAAVSQLFVTGVWRTQPFDSAVHLPTGFRAPESMRFSSTDCAPLTPANLWAQIQTMFGVHTSYEFLRLWADRTETTDQGRSIGNPVATADALRGDPTGYVLGLTPFSSNVGHAVAPYRVEDRDANTIRIWVLDSNFPYDPAQPETAVANQVAVNRFVDVDRRSNAFRFSLGATPDPSLEYQTTNWMRGSALVALPMSLFTQPRTIPMADYLAEQYFGITGDVEAELEAEGGGSWGWNEQGEFRGHWAGLRVVPSFAAGDPTVANPLLLVPTNGAPVRVTLSGKDPAHRLIVGNGGVILGAQRPDRTPGEKDAYLIESDGGRPVSLEFHPGSPSHRWVPEVGLGSRTEGELLFRFHGLNLDARQVVRIAALPNDRGTRVSNASAQSLDFHLELTAASPQTPEDQRWFGPFKLSPGAAIDLLPSRWPVIDAIDARPDEDGDGNPEATSTTPGQSIRLKTGDTGDCNRNGMLDAYDIATGAASDLNHDGWPDDCKPADNGGGTGGTGGTGGNGGNTGDPCPPKGSQEILFASLPEGTPPASALGIVHLISTAEIHEGLLTSSPSSPPGDTDPGTLSLRFDCPRGTVTLGAVNTAKAGTLRARAWAYSASDALKPVAEAEVMVPAGESRTTPITLCRPLDEDIAVVVLEFEGGAREMLRSLTHATNPRLQVQRLDFEDRPPGTVVFAQYPGVVFPDRPWIIQAEALGVGAGSGTRVLRKAPVDVDAAPLTLRFDPPQAEVRVHVGYPASENNGRPMRIALRAFDGTKGSRTPIASAEVNLAAPRAFDRWLGVTRCEADIHEVEVQFVDRPSGGLEAIDDLVFGPVPPPTTEADTAAPVVRVLSPASGTTIPQLDASNSTGGTNIMVEIEENRGLDRVQVIVRDNTGTEIRRLDDSSLRITGTAPRFRLEAVIPLAYGRTTVEVQATDTSGNTGSNASTPLVLFYRGPEPVTLGGITPAVAYPEDRVADAHPTRAREFPAVQLPTTEFTLRGASLHRLIRVWAIRADQAILPPRRDTLTAAEIVSRDDAGTELRLRLPAGLWSDIDVSTERRFRWVIEDAWDRPDRIPWTLGAEFVARQRPWPMTYGFGFVNVEGPNTLTDFDGVFGLNAYTSWSDHCWRDPVYLGFYEWGYSRTLNESPGGSCFGFVAASQSIYSGDFDPAWLNAGFINTVRLPAGRYETGPIRENNPSCGPRSPASLWAWIQTYHGMQQSEEHLYQQLNQIVRRGGVWRGNIAARAAQLGLRPYDYMLCIKPRNGTTGHCVLPYRVERLEGGITRVWVYDPNFPYYHFLPEDDPRNIRSIHSYVDLDPAANSYSFDLGANFDRDNVEAVNSRFHAGPRWSGEGLSVTLLPRGNRTMPGLGYGLDYLFSAVTGDARPRYSNAAGHAWGWDAEGKLTETLDDVHPFTPFNFAGDETDQVRLLTRSSNTWSRVEIRPRGADYHFVTGGGGVLWGIRNQGAAAGTVDHAEQRIENGTPRSIRFTSAVANDHVEPFVMLPEVTGSHSNRVAWRWTRLSLPGGAPIQFEADPATGALGARNEGSSPITARLVREGVDPSGPGSIDYGNVTLPPGTTVRLTPSGPPTRPHLREEVDLDGDGRFDRVTDRLPDMAQGAPKLVPVRTDAARKRIRLRIQDAAREDVVIERSSDLARWETVPTEPAPDDAAEVESGLDSQAAFFRLRRIR